MTRRRGALLLGMATVVAAFTGYVALTGGFDSRLAGIPVRSRSWERPGTVAAVLAVAGLFGFPREVGGVVRQLGRSLAAASRMLWRQLPLVAACWTVLAAFAFGTHVAGGADSYGYVSQARLMSRGQLTEYLPPTRGFSWPDVSYTLSPLGYTVGTSRRTIAPTYPPGLPLLMAPFAAAHPWGPFVVVPLCAAALVWLCFRLGCRFGEPLAGRLAAVLIAVSPTFLYQAMQPMSDVPVTAFWIGALVLARSPHRWSAAAAGAAASVAILIRPNLAPLAAFVVAAAATREGTFELRRSLVCAAAIGPGLLVLAGIQYVRYGSALASGYGPMRELFMTSNIVPNLERYPRWLTETHSPAIWLWLLAPIWIARTPPQVRVFAWTTYGFGFAVFAAYLPYSYFRPEEWFYTRFLLPGLPLYLLFTALTMLALSRRFAARMAQPVAIALVLALAGYLAVLSVRAGAFGLRDGELKYPAVGTFVRERLPESAFILAMQHSGSIRYYSGRHTLRWDLLDRASLDRAIQQLRDAGHVVYAAVDSDEDVELRKRFGAVSAATLEAMVPIGNVRGTQLYEFR